jgi:hypothetical protein
MLQTVLKKLTHNSFNESKKQAPFGACFFMPVAKRALLFSKPERQTKRKDSTKKRQGRRKREKGHYGQARFLKVRFGKGG